MQEVAVTPRSTRGFRDVLDVDDHQALEQALERFRSVLAGRRVWHVNSTATGGGVAELLSGLLPYAAGAGADVHRLVVAGSDEFFDVTKRVHNRLHDSEGDGGQLGERERRIYERGLEAERDAVSAAISADDVVVLHDPQTAGLAPALRRHGATVVWRCHVGSDDPGPLARGAWDFLLPDVSDAEVLVFSRREHVWDGLDPERVAIVAPCIDVLAPKNHPLDRETTDAILTLAGIVPTDDRTASAAVLAREDGAQHQVRRTADVIEDNPVPAAAPLVVQISRWDRLKDPVGVIGAFSALDGPARDAHLVLAGPATDAVDDDPESAAVFDDVRCARQRLAPETRHRVHLACLPMADADENGVIVNALQRRAKVVVQKSRAEGFGLTVAEAMWKDRPVVASRVGGIQDQIVDGESGVLVDDPTDDEAFGRAVDELLADGARCERMGLAARQRVCECFLSLHHFAHEAALLERVLA